MRLKPIRTRKQLTNLNLKTNFPEKLIPKFFQKNEHNLKSFKKPSKQSDFKFNLKYLMFSRQIKQQAIAVI
jgi:hypothetical protein